MNYRHKLFLFLLIVITFFITFVVLTNKDQEFFADFFDRSIKSYQPGVSQDLDQAMNNAQDLYLTYKKAGVDLSDGPCLSNDLMPGWVADLVHNPRVASDNDPKNQCQAYLEKRAGHFIELDLNGNFVRAL